MSEFSFGFDQAFSKKKLSDAMCDEFWSELGNALSAMIEELTAKSRHVTIETDGVFRAIIKYAGRELYLSLDKALLRVEVVVIPNHYQSALAGPVDATLVNRAFVEFGPDGPRRMPSQKGWTVHCVESSGGFTIPEKNSMEWSLHHQLAEQILAKMLFPKLAANAL